MRSRIGPVILTILDGWGFSSQLEGNAIAAARKPSYDRLLAEYPNTLIHTSGPYVGLEEGQMGNSEVGHLDMGTGRIVQMDITRIDHLIRSGELFRNHVLLDSMRHAKLRRLHLMGLLSDGGVHSMNTHLYALLDMAKRENVSKVFVHCFLDGRDTPPQSGIAFIRDLQQEMAIKAAGRIASVSGRYYAMDRDGRWERIERAFGAMVLGNGHRVDNIGEAIEHSYRQGVTDEFVEPITVVDENGPVGLVRDEDVCIVFNFRADRARELVAAFLDTKLIQPSRAVVPKNLRFTTLTRYDHRTVVPHVLAPEHPNAILADVFALEGLKNLRVAETEKYAHVTYFFNGGTERAFNGEARKLVQSPKVATYDLKPEMSAGEITAAVSKALESDAFDAIIMNFANADMVGHSGKLDPTIQAIESVDGCLGEIYKVVKRESGVWIITADHGNAETMIDPITLGPHTRHTTNPVPFILVSDNPVNLRSNGSLQDIAPTILGLFGFDKPTEMTGVDLREKTEAGPSIG